MPKKPESTTGDPNSGPSAGFSCPIPVGRYPKILLAHGGGGKLMHQLIEQMFLAEFRNPHLESRHDGAILDFAPHTLAFTTDSYVVRPLFFPGGDIGTLAVNGTVNDLAMCGARPLYVSAGFILEEGLPIDTLGRIVGSMKRSAAEAGVQLVTGDTKVVDHGKGDGVYINTAGIGIVIYRGRISPRNVQPGDAVVLSGDVGRHGVAVMAVREGLQFETTIESDCAPVSSLVSALVEAGIEMHCLRDLTRGGLATALVEIAEAAGRHIQIEEASVPVREDVTGACEILGFDPLYLANEGRFVGFIKASDAEQAVSILHAFPRAEQAGIIGRVVEEPAGLVTLESRIGTTRILDMLSGEQLPRIC